MRDFETWTIDELIEAHDVLDGLDHVERAAHADAEREAEARRSQPR